MPLSEKRHEKDSRYSGLVKVLFSLHALLFVWAVLLTVALLNQAANIQDQRREGYMVSCTDQNARRTDAIRKLDRILAAAPNRAQAEASRKPTVVLIDALVPFKDCKRLVKERVR